MRDVVSRTLTVTKCVLSCVDLKTGATLEKNMTLFGSDLRERTLLEKANEQLIPNGIKACFVKSNPVAVRQTFCCKTDLFIQLCLSLQGKSK